MFFWVFFVNNEVGVGYYDHLVSIVNVVQVVLNVYEYTDVFLMFFDDYLIHMLSFNSVYQDLRNFWQIVYFFNVFDYPNNNVDYMFIYTEQNCPS